MPRGLAQLFVRVLVGARQHEHLVETRGIAGRDPQPCEVVLEERREGWGLAWDPVAKVILDVLFRYAVYQPGAANTVPAGLATITA